MEEKITWVWQYVITVCTMIVLLSSATGVLVSLAKKEAKAVEERRVRALHEHVKQSEVKCNTHGGDLNELREVNRMALQCHDLTLQTLEKLAHGDKINGEISIQRKALQDFLIGQTTGVYSRRREDRNE